MLLFYMPTEVSTLKRANNKKFHAKDDILSQVMGPERHGHVHMLEPSVSPSEFLGEPTSFVEVMRKFSEQIEEVHTLKEKAQAIRQSNAELWQKHVELESLVKDMQNQLPREHICHDTCSLPSHTKQGLLVSFAWV